MYLFRRVIVPGDRSDNKFSRVAPIKVGGDFRSFDLLGRQKRGGVRPPESSHPLGNLNFFKLKTAIRVCGLQKGRRRSRIPCYALGPHIRIAWAFGIIHTTILYEVFTAQ